jgi:tyrosyl-tRNA synthetase
LQGYDFLHLNHEYGCDVQVGGSDQWSNILSGVEFVRRKAGKTVYAFTWPLLVNKSSGKKFGKSEGGAVWLDTQKTSPFEFYQFWFNAPDAEVEEYLLKMTLLPKADIDAVMAEQRENPAGRPAQKKLAWEVTALVHGAAEADKARDNENMPMVPAGKLRDIIPALSTSELRRLVEQGAVSCNEKKVESIDEQVPAGALIRIGKNKFFKTN